MNLLCCSRFIFSRLFILLSPLQFFFLSLYFVVTALVFCLLCVIFLAILIFCCRFIFLLPLNRRRKYKAAKKKSGEKKNKVATKNMEWLCMALLGFGVIVFCCHLTLFVAALFFFLPLYFFVASYFIFAAIDFLSPLYFVVAKIFLLPLKGTLMVI